MTLSAADEFLVQHAIAQKAAERANRGVGNPRGRAAARRTVRRFGWGHYYLNDPIDDTAETPGSRRTKLPRPAAPRNAADNQRAPETSSAGASGGDERTITITNRTTITVTTKITISGERGQFPQP